jgi:hypothetical protein
MPNQPTYVPVNCWKCSTQNNAALSKICRSCGVYPRSGEDIFRKDRYTDPISEHPGFKGFIWSGLAVALMCAGMIYYYKREGPPPELPVAEMVALPANSWYNQSWWSYISKYPSVKQIIQKNDEVSGNMPAPEIARTLSLSGRISEAQGRCFTQVCAGGGERPKPNWVKSPYGGLIRIKNQPTVIGPIQKPELEKLDKYDDLAFSEVGSVEVAAKLPGKIVKKARAKVPYGSTFRTVEVIEVFNGTTGRKTTDFIDEAGSKTSADVETMDQPKIERARAELASMWAWNFKEYTEMRFRGVEKVNDRVTFAVSSRNPEGMPETFHFDSVTGFVIKIDTIDFSTFLDNYRPYEKAVLPYTIHYRRPGTSGSYLWIKFEVDGWKIGDYLDDSMFEIPTG